MSNHGTSSDTYYISKPIGQLIPGDIILHPVFRIDGLLLVNKYTALTSSLIKQIKLHMKDSIQVAVSQSKTSFDNFIENKLFASNEFINLIKEILSSMNTSYNVPLSVTSFIDERVNMENADKTLGSNYNLFYSDTYKIITNKITSAPLWQSLELMLESEKLQHRATNAKNKFITTILVDKSLLEILQQMDDYNEVLLKHGVNITCLSILFGLTLELSDSEILDLAVAAMVCNIGFINIPKSEFDQFLVNQNNQGTVNNHIKNSISIISQSSFCRSKNIIFGIMDHHEQYNGRGEPLKKAGNTISLFGRIIAIAIAYDELVAGYSKEASISTHEAIKTILENEDGAYDPNILRVFLSRSNIYKLGQPITVTKQQKGIIIGFTDFLNSPHKPTVRLQDGREIRMG